MKLKTLMMTFEDKGKISINLEIGQFVDGEINLTLRIIMVVIIASGIKHNKSIRAQSYVRR